MSGGILRLRRGWRGEVCDRGAAEADGLYGGIYAVFMFVSWLVWRVCVGFGCEEGGVGAVGALF